MALLDNPFSKCMTCNWRTLSGFCQLTACIRMNSSNETASQVHLKPICVITNLNSLDLATQNGATFSFTGLGP